jgi:Zn-dependent protease with chaperone function
MNREQFDELVRRVEKRYAHRPVALRLKIVWYVALSYGLFLSWFLLVVSLGLVLILGGALGGGGSDAWVLISFGVAAVVGLSWYAARVFWVRLEPPEGVELRRASNPELFALLDGLCRELRAPRFHRVVVDGRCNAGVVQQPRLGVFGWQKNHLLLGLPLLDSLSPEELRAVLAHELAHLSAQHGRFGAWIYRLRVSWEKVFESLRKPRGEGISLRPIVTKFIEWFWPRFNAHAFVLSRANEYVADAGAARISGVEHIASALLRSDYYGRLLEEKTWPEVWLGANRTATPPVDVYTRIRNDIAAGAGSGEGSKWVEQAFRRTTTNADTHPSLSDRLRALQFMPADPDRGLFPPAPAAPRVSATEALFGRVVQELREELGRRWKTLVEPQWKETHARAGVLQHRLESIDRAVADPAADADSLWDKAQVTINLENDAAAEPLLRQVLALRPTHAGANFCLGRHLLTRGDEAGAAFVQQAMEEDESYVSPGCEVLIDHHRRHGREPAIREWMQRLDAHEAAVRASHAERSSVVAGDTFLPHELTEEQIKAVALVVAHEGAVRAVRIARKQLRHFPKQRLFVVVLVTRAKWFGAEARDSQLVRALNRAFTLPGRTLVITPRGPWGAVARKVSRVPGAEVYRWSGK